MYLERQKNIKFLDKNVVILCEKINNNKDVDPIKKKRLRQLDSYKNAIYPFLSYLEGSIGNKENNLEREKTIKKESKILKNFFKKAYFNEKFILEEINELIQIIEEIWDEDYRNKEMFFIEELHKILYQPIKKEKRKSVKDDIIKKAKYYDISINSILIYSILAVLYGNNTIRAIFKFTNSKPIEEIKKIVYNSYNDVYSVIFILHFNAYIKKFGKKVEYITFDKSLSTFFEYFKNVETNFIEKNSELYTNIENIQANKLFPELNDEEIEEIKNYILSYESSY
jgi:hypothetical protein